SDQKHYLANLADKLAKCKIGRRDILRKAAKLCLSMSALGALGHLPFRGRGIIQKNALAATQPSTDVMAWIKDVGKPFKGKTVRMATESTPPSNGIAQLVKSEFTPATGINVEIEVLPLEQVLQKLTMDVASGTSTYDLYYMDQSWMASFSKDTIDPREIYDSKKELAFPAYDFEDFLKPLVDGISMYKGKMVGVPYDIPIFIQMYRMDVYDELNLKVATTMDDYLNNARVITEKKKSQGIYGTTGQMKSGHYSLNCDWTAWLWGHGGSVFRPDGTFSGNDAEGLEAMDYWVKLKENMPAGVDTWTWDGEFQSVAQGIAGQVLSWGEFLPSCDDPKSSKVSGLLGVAVPPKANKLRTVKETGYGEIPNVGHQGGSALGLSKYSSVQDPAWIFMQWATCPDTQARISVLGGGSSPMRHSTFNHPDVLAAAKVGAGTTRHFPVQKETIENYMGSEPDLPEWAEISNNIIPVELGRFFAGEYKTPKETMDIIAKQVDKMLKG
ncbi:MAG: extracellular solute-binding protein, partial [Desulfobacterales bacterium]